MTADYGFARHGSTELSVRECRELLSRSTVGRIAFCTADGPRILPVNYVVDGKSVVFRTSPYGALGLSVFPADAAFEVDDLDVRSSSGWSVVLTGPAAPMVKPDQIGALRAFRDPQPWVGGSKHLYVRLRWTSITGRRVGSGGERQTEEPT